MKLLHKIWLISLAVLVLALIPAGLFTYRMADHRVETDVLKTAQTVRDLLMTVRYTYHQRFLASGLPLTGQTLGFLPAHAMASISDDFSRFHQRGIRFRNVSDRARNPANQADPTEIDVIRWFRAHPDATERLIRVDEGHEQNYLYATPIKTEPYCLTCHGEASSAPDTVRERYESGFDYQAGDLRGILSIRVPAAMAQSSVQATLLREQLIQAGGFLLALLVGGLLLHYIVVRRLKSLSSGALGLARGEYATRLDSPGRDEMADLASAFNTMAAAIEQREAALRESEARWQFALDGSELGVWDWRKDTGQVYFSPRWKAMLGYAEHEIEDRYEEWRSRVHPDDLPRSQTLIDRHLQGIDPIYANDHRLLCKDGRYKWIAARGKVIERDSDGQPRRLIGTHTDIDARKRAEAALVTIAGFASAPGGEQFCQTLVNLAGESLGLDYVHIARLRPGSTQVEVHAAWQDGAPAPARAYDLANTPCAEVCGKARRCVTHGVRERYPLDDDLRKLAAEGYVGEPIVDTRGQVLGLLVGVTRAPLTHPESMQANLRILAARAGMEFESRSANAALREERDRNQHYLDTVQTLMVALDREGRVTMVNRYGADLLGYRPEELIGEVWFATCLPQPEGMDVVFPVFQRIMRGELANVEYFENPIRRRDGEIRLIAWHNAMFQDPDGRISGTLSSGEDVTELRRAETALRESESLFHTMADWTHDLEYWTRPEGGLRYISPSAEAITGYPDVEFMANPSLLDALVKAEDRPLWDEHIAHHQHPESREEISEIDLRIVRRDGEVRWVTHTCRPVYGADGAYLGRRVTVHDISARKETEARLLRLANYDHLTGLPNRRLFVDRLLQAMAASQRLNSVGAVILLDLDRFKTFNESLGHAAGDRLLVELAARLQACLRREDTVARMGGDEFAILLDNLGGDETTAANQAETAAEKIRSAIGQPYALADDSSHHSNASLGIVLFRGQDPSAEVLLKEAEVALYQAKDAGRDTVRFFNPAMQAAVESRAELERALRRALERDELLLFYQPQTDRDGRVVGAEALLRWRRQDGVLVSPAEFIPVAEESGLILPIGQWVLDTACAQLAAWRTTAATEHLRLAINVSARQFLQPDFVERVRDSLIASAIPADRLKLELTESVVLDNVDQVITRMSQLRALGVRFSLDDFGTGYSSLAYLKRLPLDQIKIDQSFVRDLAVDPNDAAIVRAILAMSASLGLEVVAEGVETEAHRDFLDQHGCQVYQGYLFGRPMPIEAWSELPGLAGR